jgi:hypothetical protein
MAMSHSPATTSAALPLEFSKACIFHGPRSSATSREAMRAMSLSGTSRHFAAAQ